MKYSVLMSVYKKDNPDFLKAALKSIYEEQTRKPDEIVVVFDGPLTDEMYKILEDFKKGKEDIVFYYPQEINRGLGEALRIGAEKCTGDYIFRMDSDDICYPERFEKQSEYLESHPDVDVLGTSVAEFHDDPEDILRMRICPETHKEVLKRVKRINPMNHSTVCMKREALEKSGSYETVLYMEDYYLWAKMLANGFKIENFKEPLVHFRVGKDFCAKRNEKVKIKGWKKLQKLMLKHKMVNRFEALTNMMIIVGFTYCPVGIRKFVYDKLLRR